MVAGMKQFIPLLTLLSALSGVATAYPTWERRAGDPQTSLTLDPSQVQKDLEQDGSQGPGAVAGQAKAQTSSNNFINNCLKVNLPLMNGKQVQGGACNPTPMGSIAGKNKMPSLKFAFPPNGDTSLKANQAFTIKANVKNLELGTFVNPNTNYLGGPQELNSDGVIIGHSHFVIEAIPSLDSTEPTDPRVFAFFKGIDTPLDGNGQATVDVTKGIPAGFYRLTSMNADGYHAPVKVTAAQRGASDDVVYFTVGGGAKGDAAANKIDDAGAAAAAAAQSSLTANPPAKTGGANDASSSQASSSQAAKTGGAKDASSSQAVKTGGAKDASTSKASKTDDAKGSSSSEAASSTASAKGAAASAKGDNGGQGGNGGNGGKGGNGGNGNNGGNGGNGDKGGNGGNGDKGKN